MSARAASSSRVEGESTAPPPSATTTGSGRVEHVGRDLLLDRAEPRLPGGCEEVDDRRAGAPLDLTVEVDERPVQPSCHLLAHGRLARAHEAREREMAAECVQVAGCHRSEMRSR